MRIDIISHEHLMTNQKQPCSPYPIPPPRKALTAFPPPPHPHTSPIQDAVVDLTAFAHATGVPAASLRLQDREEEERKAAALERGGGSRVGGALRTSSTPDLVRKGDLDAGAGTGGGGAAFSRGGGCRVKAGAAQNHGPAAKQRLSLPETGATASFPPPKMRDIMIIPIRGPPAAVPLPLVPSPLPP